MELNMTSRTDLAAKSQPPQTLADVALWLAQNSEMPERQRADFASALRTFARITGKPLAHHPAHAGEIRRLLDQKSPAQWDMKTASFRNFKSRLLTLLRKAGCRVVRGRHQDSFPGPWQALWDALDKHRSLRYDLSHAMHWHAANGIQPETAGPESFATYCKDAVEFGTKENRRLYYKRACIAWNRAGELVGSWPKARIEVPNRRQVKSRPWTEFDERFVAEAQAYLASLGKFSSATAAAKAAASRPWRQKRSGKRKKPLKEPTIEQREYHIRLFASFALALAVSREEISSLRDFVSMDVAGRVIDHLWEKAGETPTSYIAGFAWMIRGIARDWVKVEAEQLEELDGLCAFVTPKTGDMTPKNRNRLAQVRDPEREQDLRWLPNRLADRARKAKTRLIPTARTMMNACMVGLLMYCPMRRHNLAELRIADHLRRIPKGKSTIMLVDIPGGAVKNGVPTRYPVPDEIAEMIEEYLVYHRPLICLTDSPWLFPTRNGKAVHKNAVSNRVSKLIKRETGLEWNPHLFRHWDGRTYIEEQPGDYETVRRFLHHENQETSRTYLGNDSEAAIRLFQDVILKRRARLSMPAGRVS
jgi:integrase